MLKIRRPLGRLIFNMGIAIPGKTVFLIETAPRSLQKIHPTTMQNLNSQISQWLHISHHNYYAVEFFVSHHWNLNSQISQWLHISQITVIYVGDILHLMTSFHLVLFYYGRIKYSDACISVQALKTCNGIVFFLFAPHLNSLPPGKFEWNFRYVIFKRILVIDGWGISCEIALMWLSLDFTNDQSILI